MERNRLRGWKSAATIEGNAQNSKSRSLSKQSSDSYLFSDGFTNGNEFCPNSYNGAGGKPIKKLLAEEMTKECEPKKRSPSLIARLMGLEGLPSPQHGHKQHKKASEKRHQQTSQSVEYLSSRRNSIDQLEFKDVYEDLEASNISNRCYSSRRVSDYRLKKSSLEQVHQKNKHILSNERVPASKESVYSFELPDSVFIEQFHEDNSKVWEPERANECQFDASSCRKREDGLLLQLHNRHKSLKSCRHPPENRFCAKIEKNVLPTQIVLLKPNLEKTSNSNALFPSPSSPHTHSSSFKKHLECRRAKADELQKWIKRNLSNAKTKCGKDRELARAITRHMRESLGGPFSHDLTFSAHPGVRGYAGDESSSDVYESDSSNGFEGMNISSRNSLDGFKSSPFVGLESSNSSTEAKKRLSERWKMSQGCRDSKPIGKGSTLGEMLAVPDRMARHVALEASSGSNYGKHRDGGPTGISSKDGWKEGDIRNSSRSKSLPRYSSGSRVYKMNEPRIDDLIPSEKKRGRSKSRKPYDSYRKFNDGFDGSFDEVDSDISLNKQGEEEKLVLKSVGPDIRNICLGSDVNGEDATASFANNMYCKQSDNILKDHNSCGDDQEAALKEPEPECSENSKEADHHSPVSVLGVSFAEDQSSNSDCFETVNSELNELRMQLQLLKMESGNYVEESPSLFLNDDDFTQQAESDCWKSTYINDVLINSDIEATIDHDSFLAAWHSPNCPLDPWIFDIVEKKYRDNNDVTVTKMERKLLFDGMNTALLEAFQEIIDPRPWVRVRPVLCGFRSSRCVRDALHKFIVEMEECCSRERKEKEMDREMNWLRVEDCTDVIGKEIEELIVDELLGEAIFTFLD